MPGTVTHSPSAGSDLEARFTEAMGLISGHPALEDVQNAVALLESASSEGYAAAGERLATFHAMAANGPGGPRHWDQAFDELLVAAEQGSSCAGAQLLLLANPAEDPDVPSSIEPGFWKAVRARIDLASLLASPERRALRDSPRIRQIDGFASAAECNWVISASSRHLARATIYDHKTGVLVEDPARNNSAVSLLWEEMDVICEILRTRIAFATRVPVAVFEPAQILRYEVGQEFVPHYDFLEKSSPGFAEELAKRGQRIATFLIYLNEDFEGGETAFPSIGLQCRARTGDAIFWANLDVENKPDPLTLHAGLPPTSGEKWVFSQWIRERPQAA